jgi:hypothetical protein
MTVFVVCLYAAMGTLKHACTSFHYRAYSCQGRENLREDVSCRKGNHHWHRQAELLLVDAGLLRLGTIAAS